MKSIGAVFQILAASQAHPLNLVGISSLTVGVVATERGLDGGLLRTVPTDAPEVGASVEVLVAAAGGDTEWHLADQGLRPSE